jgi:tRNA pseudouridine13 synthase
LGIETTPYTYDLNFPFAYGGPKAEADFRCSPEDFFVDEQLGFELSGEGEHVYLHLQKRGDNTEWLARQIAKLADVQPMDVGYCGLKDRHAVTRQWFSVYLPKGAEPQWETLNSDTVKLLSVARHRQKLRRGQHRSNRFEICLRNLSGEVSEETLQAVFEQGVPNYFGEQRFGHGGNNLVDANIFLHGERKIKNRQRRGMLMSAARSWLFNLVLGERIRQESETWRQANEGEALSVEEETVAAGPLWGRGRSLVSGETLAFEEGVLDPWKSWCEALEHVGLDQQRRALNLRPIDGSWQWLDPREGDAHTGLRLSFELPPGTYATAVLRELSRLNNLSTPDFNRPAQQ